MDNDSIYVGSKNYPGPESQSASNQQTETKPSQEKKKKGVEPPPVAAANGMSTQAKLLLTALILFFVAINIWGYYFYKKGFFGISANLTTNTPTPSPSGLEKSDSIYMLMPPGV